MINYNVPYDTTTPILALQPTMDWENMAEDILHALMADLGIVSLLVLLYLQFGNLLPLPRFAPPLEVPLQHIVD